MGHGVQLPGVSFGWNPTFSELSRGTQGRTHLGQQHVDLTRSQSLRRQEANCRRVLGALKGDMSLVTPRPDDSCAKRLTATYFIKPTLRIIDNGAGDLRPWPYTILPSAVRP